MGMRTGDVLLRLCDNRGLCTDATRVADVQDFTRAHSGEHVTIAVRRGVIEI